MTHYALLLPDSQTRHGRTSAHGAGAGRRVRKRAGFSVVEVLGAITIGIIFIALSVMMLADQNERERTIELATDLTLALEGGEKYLRANLSDFEDLDELSPAATQADRSVREVCLAVLVQDGYLPENFLERGVLYNPYGLQIHLSIARLENARTEQEGKPDLYAVAAFTQGDPQLLSTKSLLNVAESLGDAGGYGTGRGTARSYVGWGQTYDTTTTPIVPGAFLHENDGPLWTFRGNPNRSDFPLIAAVNDPLTQIPDCPAPTATPTNINLSGQAVAVSFVTIYPPARVSALDNLEEQELTLDPARRASSVEVIQQNMRSYTTETQNYVNNCERDSTVNNGRTALLRDPEDAGTTLGGTERFGGADLSAGARDLFCRRPASLATSGHYMIPNAHMARLSVDSINAYTIEALRLEVVPTGVLKVKGDLKTPALRLDTDEVYTSSLTLSNKVRFKRFGPRGTGPEGQHQNLNGIYVNSNPYIGFVCGGRIRGISVPYPTGDDGNDPAIRILNACKDPNAVHDQ
jgi:hypothetical protein